MSNLDQFLTNKWRAVPSCAILFPESGVPVTWSIIAYNYVLIANGLDKEIAAHICEVHNASLPDANTKPKE